MGTRLNTNLTYKPDKTSVINNLTTDDSTKALSATMGKSLNDKLGNKKVRSNSTQVTFTNNIGNLTHNCSFSTGNSYQLMAVVSNLILIRSDVTNGNVAQLEVRSINGSSLSNYSGTVWVNWIAVGL